MRKGNGMMETPWDPEKSPESAAGVVAVHAIPAGKTTGHTKMGGFTVDIDQYYR